MQNRTCTKQANPAVAHTISAEISAGRTDGRQQQMRPRCTEEGSTGRTKGKIEHNARKEKKTTSRIQGTKPEKMHSRTNFSNVKCAPVAPRRVRPIKQKEKSNRPQEKKRRVQQVEQKRQHRQRMHSPIICTNFSNMHVTMDNARDHGQDRKLF